MAIPRDALRYDEALEVALREGDVLTDTLKKHLNISSVEAHRLQDVMETDGVFLGNFDRIDRFQAQTTLKKLKAGEPLLSDNMRDPAVYAALQSLEQGRVTADTMVTAYDEQPRIVEALIKKMQADGIIGPGGGPNDPAPVLDKDHFREILGTIAAKDAQTALDALLSESIGLGPGTPLRGAKREKDGKDKKEAKNEKPLLLAEDREHPDGDPDKSHDQHSILDYWKSSPFFKSADVKDNGNVVIDTLHGKITHTEDNIILHGNAHIANPAHFRDIILHAKQRWPNNNILITSKDPQFRIAALAHGLAYSQAYKNHSREKEIVNIVELNPPIGTYPDEDKAALDRATTLNLHALYSRSFSAAAASPPAPQHKIDPKQPSLPKNIPIGSRQPESDTLVDNQTLQAAKSVNAADLTKAAGDSGRKSRWNPLKAIHSAIAHFKNDSRETAKRPPDPGAGPDPTPSPKVM